MSRFLSRFLRQDEPLPPEQRKAMEDYIRNLVPQLVDIPETKAAWIATFNFYVPGTLRRRLRVCTLENFVGEPYFVFLVDGKQLFNGR